RAPSLPEGARGEPAWATAGRLPVGDEPRPAPLPERKPSRWGWGLAILLVLGAAAAMVFREDWRASAQAVLREHGLPSLDAVLGGREEPPAEAVPPVPAPQEVPPASPEVQPEPEAPAREAPSVQVPPKKKERGRTTAATPGVRPVAPPIQDGIDAGGPTEAEAEAAPGAPVAGGEAGESEPSLETKVEPEAPAPDSGPQGTGANPSEAPVTGEVEPQPLEQPQPSTPAEEGGAREVETPQPAAADAGVEAVPE
ncbi:hypothetical protein ACLESD_13390, partial [Pyxidicoccus sp. 3LFB2]